jgi:hypothetical protein
MRPALQAITIETENRMMFPTNTKLLGALFVTCCIAWEPANAGAQTICSQQPAISVNNGLYKVQNNEFGSTAQECIEVNGTLFTVIESSISNSKSSGPGAYPSIYRGCHWGRCTSNSGLPVQVDSIRKATSDWNTTQPSSGTYAAAYDLWFNTTPKTRGQPDGAEIMIWLNHKGHIRPFGKTIAKKVKIGNQVYDVWYGRQSNGSTSWNLISYLARKKTFSVSNLDIKAFTDDAAHRDYISPSWHLIAIEAGFELWEGGAGLSTNSFSASVNGSTSTTSPANE